MSTSPPLAALKKLKPSPRSSRMKNCEAAMNGVAITTSSEVAKFAHTSSGIRKKLMPGARIVMIVTRKLSAVMIEEAPANWTATEKNTCPIGAVVRQRRVGRPAVRERAARGEEAPEHHDPRHRQQPERERVQAREGHVRGADHQRDHVVPEAREHGDDEQEDQQRGVDREQAVERVRVDEVRARLGQLGAHQHRDQAAYQQEEERVDHVLDPDHLVVGVDPEVVLPAVGAVAGVVLRTGAPPRRPVEPVVEAAEADQEAERRGDQRDRQDRVAGE